MKKWYKNIEIQENISNFAEKTVKFRIQTKFDDNNDGGQGDGLFIDEFIGWFGSCVLNEYSFRDKRFFVITESSMTTDSVTNALSMKEKGSEKVLQKALG